MEIRARHSNYREYRKSSLIRNVRLTWMQIVGAITLILFVLYDAYIHKGDPLLPIHLFKSRGYLAMVITAMVGSCVYYSMSVIWPQQIAYLFPGSHTHKGWLACIVGGLMSKSLLCHST